MGYAIVGYFDEKTDMIIRSLWRGMADANVCNYLINSANNPHIKFAMFDSLDASLTEARIQDIANSKNGINVQFKSYSFYPNDKPFVCIDIAPSVAVLELQQCIFNECNGLGVSNSREYFVSGIWKPDCQLTISFEKSNLCRAMHFLSDTSLPIDGRLDRIGLIEFHPAKQMFSYRLTTH